jgi:hypothetical protein
MSTSSYAKFGGKPENDSMALPFPMYTNSSVLDAAKLLAPKNGATIGVDWLMKGFELELGLNSAK